MAGRGGVKWRGTQKGALNQERVTDHRLETGLIAPLVKNLPAMQETPVDSWVRKIHWRRDRLPTPVFLGFPCGSAGKKICLQCRRPGFNPWVGKIFWRRERLPTPGFGPGEFYGLYSLWGCKESDTTEWWLSLSKDKNAVYKFCIIRIFKHSGRLEE